MNAQDIIKTSRKAKSETETFINRYFDDQAKGWPRVCLAGPGVIPISDSAMKERNYKRIYDL